MKNSKKVNKTVKVLVSGILATALFFTAQNIALANNEKTVTAASASVNYVGKQNGNLMFRVSFNSVANTSTLTLTDENGEMLYSEVVKNSGYQKTFAVPQDLGVAKVNFIIKTNVATDDGSITTDQIKTFDVNNLLANNTANSITTK